MGNFNDKDMKIINWWWNKDMFYYFSCLSARCKFPHKHMCAFTSLCLTQDKMINEKSLNIIEITVWAFENYA